MTWDEMEVLHAKTLLNLCGGVWDKLTKEEQANGLEVSRAALTALREAGVRFVPQVVTSEMVDACAPTHEGETIIYRVMLNRALDAGEIKPEDGK